MRKNRKKEEKEQRKRRKERPAFTPSPPPLHGNGHVG